MAQWFYALGGTQQGPVDESYILAWIQQGRLGVNDLLWTEGMAQWAPAGSLFPHAFAWPQSSLGVPKAPSGTGGQTPNYDLLRMTWHSFAGRWGLPIGTTLLYMLITGVIQNIPHIGGLVALILDGAFQLGIIVFFLTFARSAKPELVMIFSGFNRFGQALGTYLLIVLFTFLWMLLLIVPGIIASLAYSQAFYILADNPDIGPLEAIRRSKAMMRGHKWKLFCLQMWFFLISLVCMATLCIGFIWAMPWMLATAARFYDDLAAPATAAQPALSSEPIQ